MKSWTVRVVIAKMLRKGLELLSVNVCMFGINQLLFADYQMWKDYRRTLGSLGNSSTDSESNDTGGSIGQSYS